MSECLTDSVLSAFLAVRKPRPAPKPVVLLAGEARHGTSGRAPPGPNSPMNSPFSSAPGTCLPYGGGAVSSFNVLISGSNLYQANIDYGWQEFLTEVRGSKGLNGGLSTGLSSGLIGQSDWENGYGWVYADLSRKVSQASDDVSRSYQVLFTNNSNVQCDYIIIIGYEREIGISLANGSLVV